MGIVSWPDEEVSVDAGERSGIRYGPCRALAPVDGAERGLLEKERRDGPERDGGTAALDADARRSAYQLAGRRRAAERPLAARGPVVQRHEWPLLGLCRGRYRARGVPRAFEPLLTELRQLLQSVQAQLRGLPQEPPAPRPLRHPQDRRPRRKPGGEGGPHRGGPRRLRVRLRRARYNRVHQEARDAARQG